MFQFAPHRRDGFVEPGNFLINPIGVDLKLWYLVLRLIENQCVPDGNAPSNAGATQREHYSSSPNRSLMSCIISAVAA